MHQNARFPEALLILLVMTTLYLKPQSSPAQEASTQSTDPSQWLERDFWTTVDGKPSVGHWDFSGDEIQLTHPRGGPGSLLSPPLPPNFELEWEWKIEAGTNSGLKYRVHKSDGRWLGLEYQIIDEKMTKFGKASTASIYDLVAPQSGKPILPPGQWNHSKVIASGSHVSHYLNGALISECVTVGATWEEKLAKSKFWAVPNFASEQKPQRIMLTDHGGKASFRDFSFRVIESFEQSAQQSHAPYLANGIKTSWVTENSATVWSRTTKSFAMNSGGANFLDIPESKLLSKELTLSEQDFAKLQMPPGHDLDQMLGACPGLQGEIRLSYFPEKQNKAISTTDWVKTDATRDFTHQWKLTGLLPDRRYAVVVEARPIDETTVSSVLRGHFQTAPASNALRPITFCMTTCHDFIRRDDGMNGHKIYPSMNKLNPDFSIHAGDIEYYDKPFPWATSKELMRFKWNRIFALSSNRDFYSNHTAYFLKDDHDTLRNDCWPGQTYGSVTFEEGKQIFNLEQFPSIQQRYQTIRWGRDLQVWFLEGRDYRSPNNMPDGPAKTILGSEQKQWLFKTIEESESRFKLIISPTPIIGPDRKNKRDNHANAPFTHEGEEIRSRLSRHSGVIIFCGDRHWQYASKDRDTDLWEFGCGPGSEKHQLGWREGELHPLHQFLRVAGGFLSGQLTYGRDDSESPTLTLRHHKVSGEVVSEFNFATQ